MVVMLMALHVDDGILVLHVDDGILVRDRSSPIFQKTLKGISSKFNIKEWHRLDAEVKREDEEYLGARWNQDLKNHTITCDMCRYMAGIVPVKPPRGVHEDTELDRVQQKSFRSQVMKLSWPVRHVIPQLAYGVSVLSSKLNQATFKDWNQLYKLQLEAKDLVEKGEAKIVFRKVDLDKLVVVTSLDASFAKEEGMKSQCGFISVITESDIVHEPTLCNIVEYTSTRISRVVKATMAA
jgi:hypothetical protein